MLWLRTKCSVYRQICFGLTAKQICSGDGSLGTVPICLLQGEYDAKQAYQAFDEQLRQPKDTQDEIVLSMDHGYSNIFYKKGGNESYSAMANTLRGFYGSDVLMAPAYSFTGSVIQADYTEKLVSSMIMPNGLVAFHREMTGSELKEYVRSYVEGVEDENGFTPFNRGSLPVVSGISIEVQEKDGFYTLIKVKKDGKEKLFEEKTSENCLCRSYIADCNFRI